MTATERLRELLDERGIEYEVKHYDDGIDGITGVWWYGRGGLRYLAINGIGRRKGSLYVNDTNVTPEQAIAATVGDTCCIRGGECDQCGAYIHKQANTYWVPTGEGLRTVERHDVHYCPHCGARVVEYHESD